MKKKFFIVIFALIIFMTTAVTISLAVPQVHKPSDYKIGVSYKDALRSDKPMLALFYTDWCGYCMKFMPKFKTLSYMYNGRYNLVMINAEAPENYALVKSVSLTGYPTLYILDPKYDNRVLLNNGLYSEPKSLAVELDRYLRIRNILDKSSVK